MDADLLFLIDVRFLHEVYKSRAPKVIRSLSLQPRKDLVLEMPDQQSMNFTNIPLQYLWVWLSLARPQYVCVGRDKQQHITI